MVSIYSHLAEGRVASLLRTLRFLNLNPNLNRFPQPGMNTIKIKSKIMIKREITGFVGCSIAALCVAATVSRGAGSDAQVNRWFEVQTNLQSWSAGFTQTRSLKVLSQPLVSTGKVWVTPGEFRWELGQPVQTIVLRQPDQLLIIYPRLKQEYQ